MTLFVLVVCVLCLHVTPTSIGCGVSECNKGISSCRIYRANNKHVELVGFIVELVGFIVELVGFIALR